MPNGYHGTAQGWERLERPLRRLDAILDEFAGRHRLALTRNERNWPDRCLRWGDRPAILIQLFLESETAPSYTMWVSAWDDRSRAEYWEHKTLIKSASIDELERQWPELLEAAYAIANQWVATYRGPG